MKKVLVAASTLVHIQNFHMPYIEKLKQKYDVKIMARGKDFLGNSPDFDVKFTKNILSITNLKNIAQVQKILMENEFDIIYLNTALAAIIIRLALKFMHLKKRPKVIYIVHGYLFDNHTFFVKRWFYLLAEKFVRKQTDTIICMNQYDLQVVKKHKLCKNDVKFIKGMGVRDLRNKKCEVKQDLGLLKFCFIGELSKRKNQQFLIRFIDKLKKKNINAQLFLVGYGNQTEKLKRLTKKLKLQENIIFVGYEKYIENILPKIDYYISSSKIEGSPFNIVEAMEFGKIIFSADVKGCKDVLKNNVNGILYKPFSQKDLMNKFLNTYENEEDKQRISSQAIIDSEEFLFESVFDDNIKLFIDCIEK